MNTKKAIGAMLVIFLGFWMFTDPQGLADAARSGFGQAWNLAEQLFSAIIRFFGALV